MSNPILWTYGSKVKKWPLQLY